MILTQRLLQKIGSNMMLGCWGCIACFLCG